MDVFRPCRGERFFRGGCPTAAPAVAGLPWAKGFGPYRGRLAISGGGAVSVGVGLDDVLDEAVADDVGFVEFDEGDAFDAAEGF